LARAREEGAMTAGRRRRPATDVLAACCALALVAGCATRLTADGPKAVAAHPLPPFASHDECARLSPGDRLEYAFEASEPVAFEIRYREGTAVVAPVVRERSRGDAGMFVARLARDYCAVWEAGGAGALIDYRLRLRPAAQ
jgi:hypothetical protein